MKLLTQCLEHSNCSIHVSLKPRKHRALRIKWISSLRLYPYSSKLRVVYMFWNINVPGNNWRVWIDQGNPLFLFMYYENTHGRQECLGRQTQESQRFGGKAAVWKCCGWPSCCVAIWGTSVFGLAAKDTPWLSCPNSLSSSPSPHRASFRQRSYPQILTYRVLNSGWRCPCICPLTRHNQCPHPITLKASPFPHLRPLSFPPSLPPTALCINHIPNK